MSQDRFVRLQALFEHAIQLAPEARPAWLLRECGSDRAMLDEVEALIAAEAATDHGFADLIGRAVRDALESGIDISGRRIGPYRIVRTIGQGGMGAVYLAERADEQYRGQVAIKLSNTLFATPLAIERLRVERQILANLDHPNIARLLDGGTTAEGMPYLIMEYIEGVPIDVYCDQHELGLRERVELFRTVCAAVHYAHQHLVVHRDIKPSNILVTKDGRAKLLDFGIAKLLDEAERAQRESQHTVAEQRMLSPEYASPEHITGQPITTASDIYSLGVLLYKLLAGRLPYDFGGGTLLDLARLVTTTAPAPPSTTVHEAQGSGASGDVRAHFRQTTPDRLARALRGDLDNIVMVALRKEPERRYRSASQFADDLQRYLTGRPVSARRDTWHYRCGKFLSRHPFGVAAACAAVLFLVGYAATLWVQNERIRAEQERAEAAAEFLVGLFELFDPERAQGDPPTVEEILQTGEARVDADLRTQPALQATLLDALGRVHYSHGRHEEARRLLERALEEKRVVVGPKDVSFAQTMSALAATYFDMDRVDDAERLAHEAFEIVSHELGATSLPAARSMTQLARVLHGRGRLAEAEQALRQAIVLLRERGSADESLSVAENFLANVYVSEGDLLEAQELYTQMLARDRARLGADHPLMLKNLASLAVVMEQRGDYGHARCTFVEALDGMRRVLGQQHPDVGAPLNGLARVLLQLGDLHGAELQFREALAIDRVQGEDHWTVAYDKANLAVVLHAAGRLQESAALFREALAAYDHDEPGRLTYIGAAQMGLGGVLIDLGQLEDAAVAFEEALASWEHSPTPPPAWMPALTRVSQGRAALAAGRYDEAERLLVPAVPLLEAGRDHKDYRVRRAWSALTELYDKTGRPQLAAQYRARLAESETQIAQLASMDCALEASLR